MTTKRNFASLFVSRISFSFVALAGIAILTFSAAAFAATPGGSSADLIVSKTGDESAPRGTQINYNIVVSNDGPSTANGVVLTDPIPAHTTFVNAAVSQGTFGFASNTVTANLGSINLGESATVSVTVLIDQDTPRDTIISNIATVTSDTADPEGSNNSSTAFTAVTGPFSSDLVISEFRLSGPGTGKAGVVGGVRGLGNTTSDEFIEIYNNTGQPHLVSGAGGGYAIVADGGKGGIVLCTIPNGTVIPKNGHFLCANSNGYSLSGYPAGNGTTATPNASYTIDIPDNTGIALFNNSNGDYTTDTRLDAVGSTSEANTLFKEGTGYPPITPTGINYSFYRDNCGRQGVVSQLQPCTITTGVIDTDNNATDFIFVDTNGTSAGAGQRLGAPGPENLSSPFENNAEYGVTFLDPCVVGSAQPNQVRDLTPDPQNSSTLGTIELRRTITNNSINAATRLRFRVTQQTTFPAPPGTADLRLRTSSDTEVSVDRVPCGMDTSSVTVIGTVLEQPPGQPNGGAFNSTVSAISPVLNRLPIRGGNSIGGTLQLSTPLNPGESIDVRFLFGVQQSGKFRVTLNIEVVEEEPIPVERPSTVKKSAAPASRKSGAK
ncbi:MAG TPA: DUF11 domain-containing protein [Pyrinomonadaceae bacterium]|nr:DUF11 domain-containing protein [Pyrinomonadaceae bacterium]